MDRERAWRIATGAMLLAVGASRLLPPATSYFLVAFGGALFGAVVGSPAASVIGGRQGFPIRQTTLPAISPQALQIEPMKPRRAHGVLLAASMVLAAGGLFLYPLLTHETPPRLQTNSATARPASTIGRAVAPSMDPQLHLVSLGENFVLSRARIAIHAASVCRSGGSVRVDVPAAIRALSSGVTINEPEYQLLDAEGAPHQPVATVQLDRPRADGTHAVPPPTVYRESINFNLPAASARGALKLQAVLPTGSGPEYRVTVAEPEQNSRRSSSVEDLPATCASPGEQGV
jgi:hypothetical protein